MRFYRMAPCRDNAPARWFADGEVLSAARSWEHCFDGRLARVWASHGHSGIRMCGGVFSYARTPCMQERSAPLEPSESLSRGGNPRLKDLICVLPDLDDVAVSGFGGRRVA
jgi:hypothetical protein